MIGCFPIGTRALAETKANALVLGRVYAAGYAPIVPSSVTVSPPCGSVVATGYAGQAGNFEIVRPPCGTVHAAGYAATVRTNSARAAHAYLNVLEDSSVALTQGTENAAFPAKRLYDRRVAQPFKTSSTGTLEVHVDQGSSPAEVDRLIIPSGHDLSGLTVRLEYSYEDVAWMTAAEFVAHNSVLDAAFTPVTARFWRFTVDNPSRVVTIPEIFLTKVYTWDRLPQRPGGPEEPQLNASSIETVAGEERFIVNGPPRRQMQYTLKSIPDAQKAALLALWSSWAGGNPFWVFSHRGAWIFCKFTEDPKISEVYAGRHDAKVSLLEVV